MGGVQYEVGLPKDIQRTIWAANILKNSLRLNNSSCACFFGVDSRSMNTPDCHPAEMANLRFPAYYCIYLDIWRQ
jgi:hypothetical protein